MRFAFKKGDQIEVNALGGWTLAQFIKIDSKNTVWVIHEGQRCCTSIRSIRKPATLRANSDLQK